MTTGHEDVPYHLDLPYPVTLHGAVVHRCPACGEYEVEILRVESLHRAIAMNIAQREGRLHPKEIRLHFGPSVLVGVD